MSAAIDFAVRSSAGGTTNGIVGGDDQANFIQVGAGDSISLNVSKESVLGYQRVESDLVVELADGSTVVLLGWFNAPEGVVNHLYLSSDGQIAEVLLTNGSDGFMVADYGPVSNYDKWSPLDDLRFDSGDPVVASAGATNEPAGMGLFTPALLGMGGGGLGAAALGGAALAGGAAVLGGGGSGSGGGGGVAPNPLDVGTVAGDDLVNKTEQQQPVVIGGTASAGSTVTVTIPGVVNAVPVTADGQGNWTYPIPGGTLADGTYTVTATTTNGAGQTSTATGSFVVDTVTQVNFNSTAGHAVLGDGYVNLAESQRPMTITGKAEAGSTKVELSWQGQTYAATVDAAGNWSATLPAGAAGNVSGATVMTVTSTDRAGNTGQNTLNVTVDLEAGVAVTSQPGGADRVLSGAEQTAGFVLTGTADAGATVYVSYMGQSRTAVADGQGNWSLSYSAAQLASGEIASGAAGGRFEVYSVDLAQNRSATVTKDFAVDTLVRDFSFANPDLVGAVNSGALDGQKLNAAERADGLLVNGTVEPGSMVTISVGANSTTVQAVGGNWSYRIPAAWLPEGSNTQAIVKVQATDVYGNASAWQEKTVLIDTSVTNFAKSDVSFGFGADNMLNAKEAAAGVPVSGKAEAGSSVTVTVNGVSHTVLADANGIWTTTFTRAELPSGEFAALPASVRAVDPNGNVAEHSFTFGVDTVAPTSPDWVQDAGGGGALSGVFTTYSPDTYTYHSVAAAGQAVDISPPAGVFRTPVNVGGQVVDSELALFSSNVPDGSYLVIRDVDTAGNESSTLYLRTTVATDVDLSRPGLAGFDIATVDLSSTQGRLTITEAQLNAITGPDHKLVVRGGADDQVSLVGATATNQTHTDADGHHYAVYTLNGNTVFVDEDITNRSVI